jgi:hypothetical protein
MIGNLLPKLYTGVAAIGLSGWLFGAWLRFGLMVVYHATKLAGRMLGRGRYSS